jgi:hypothetical protein
LRRFGRRVSRKSQTAEGVVSMPMTSKKKTQPVVLMAAKKAAKKAKKKTAKKAKRKAKRKAKK